MFKTEVQEHTLDVMWFEISDVAPIELYTDTFGDEFEFFT